MIGEPGEGEGWRGKTVGDWSGTNEMASEGLETHAPAQNQIQTNQQHKLKLGPMNSMVK